MPIMTLHFGVDSPVTNLKYFEIKTFFLKKKKWHINGYIMRGCNLEINSVNNIKYELAGQGLEPTFS